MTSRELLKKGPNVPWTKRGWEKLKRSIGFVEWSLSEWPHSVPCSPPPKKSLAMKEQRQRECESEWICTVNFTLCLMIYRRPFGSRVKKDQVRSFTCLFWERECNGSENARRRWPWNSYCVAEKFIQDVPEKIINLAGWKIGSSKFASDHLYFLVLVRACSNLKWNCSVVSSTWLTTSAWFSARHQAARCIIDWLPESVCLLHRSLVWRDVRIIAKESDDKIIDLLTS